MSIYSVEFNTASHPLNPPLFVSIIRPSVFLLRTVSYMVHMSQNSIRLMSFHLEFWKLYGHQIGKITSWIIGPYNWKI